jgi:hypothetical protein
MPKSSAQFGKYSPDGSVQLPLLATPAEIMGHHSADTEKGGAPSVIALDYQGGFGKTLGETKGRIQQLFDRKLSESSPEFRASIAKKGVQVPVGLQVKSGPVQLRRDLRERLVNFKCRMGITV